MSDLNAVISEMLQEAGITCRACETPEPEDAGSGPYIVWRHTAKVPHYASGEVWATEHHVLLTLVSGLTDDKAATALTASILDKLLGGLPPQEGLRLMADGSAVKGDYMDAISRRRYEIELTFVEYVP